MLILTADRRKLVNLGDGAVVFEMDEDTAKIVVKTPTGELETLGEYDTPDDAVWALKELQRRLFMAQQRRLPIDAAVPERGEARKEAREATRREQERRDKERDERERKARKREDTLEMLKVSMLGLAVGMGGTLLLNLVAAAVKIIMKA